MADYEKNLVVIITNASFNQTDHWREAISGIKMNPVVVRPDSIDLPQLIDDAEFIMMKSYVIELYSFFYLSATVIIHNK